MWQKIVRTILGSPALKTSASVGSTVITGVLCGTFVTEITVNGAIEWSLFHKSVSFYVLLAVAVVLYVYNKSVYRFEMDVMRFADTEYCMAYVRSHTAGA